MVQAFRRTRVVGAPADEVWRRMTDWDRAAGWLGVDAIRADGPTEEGTTLRFDPRGKEHTSQITAVDPGRSVTLRSHQGGVTADYTYVVAPDPGGTEVTVTADVRTRGPWRLAGPMIRAAIRRTDSDQLDRLDRELGAR